MKVTRSSLKLVYLLNLCVLAGCGSISSLLTSKSNETISDTTAQSTIRDVAGTAVAKLDVPSDVTMKSSVVDGLPAETSILSLDSSGYVYLTRDMSTWTPQTYVINYQLANSRGDKSYSGKLNLTVADQTISTSGFAWGSNATGGFANSTLVDSNTPTTMSALPASLKSLSVSETHSCGLTTSGQLYCWGSGARGMLGQGNTSDSNVPVAVGGSLRFRSFSTNSGAWSGTIGHTCAIAVDGTLYCWGTGGDGQLGNGTTTDQSLPTAVATSLKFKFVSAGATHTCAIGFNDLSYCWGAGTNGQLGNGDTNQRLVPTAVSTTQVFKKIAAAAATTCALTATGDLYCWGFQAVASGPYLTTPTQRGSGRTYTDLDGDASSVCVVDSTGLGWCFGHAMYGRLGIGNWDGVNNVYLFGIGFGDYVYDLTIVSMSTRIKAVNVGRSNGCAIDVNDSAWCWGEADNYAVGNGISVGASPNPYGPYGFYAPVLLNDGRQYSQISVSTGISAGLQK